MVERQKKEWFEDYGAEVDDLTAEEVKQLAKDLGLIKDEEEATETPTDE